MCDNVCVAVWPVLLADDDAKPVGNWSVITRDDGRKQWAYKSRPVYTFYQDTPNNPQGIGMVENWYYDALPADFKSVRAEVAAKGADGKPSWHLLKP